MGFFNILTSDQYAMLTRCPSCKTIFRIEESHLEVAGGQVRCGRCQAVFDARWSLVPDTSFLSPTSAPATEQDASWEPMPPFPAEQATAPAPSTPSPAREEAAEGEAQEHPAEAAGGEAPDSPVEENTVTRFMEAIAPSGEGEEWREPPPGAQPPAETREAAAPGPRAGDSAPPAGADGEASERDGDAGPAGGGGRTAPELTDAAFLFEEDLELPPSRPVWPWALGSLLLLIALAGQVLLLRPELPAAWDPLRPVVEAACRHLPCSLPQRLAPDAFEILAHDMVNDGETVRIHLSFVNTAPFPQPWPLLEIVLSDAAGTAVAAGRFTPAEYLPEAATTDAMLPPQRPAQANLRLEPVAGAVSWQFRFFFPESG
ncbi:MAG TPA: DUF3426 domain-containing protein [Thiotrichales bacterium]|nr:DUF3426 domain-containing protein [Thiotrichales bacterium]